jgi:hypothetical protein
MQPMGYRKPSYYKKPSVETVIARRDEYAKKYANEIKQLSNIIKTMTEKGMERNEFIASMFTVLSSGSRPFTEKMHKSVINAINDPRYDVEKQIIAKQKIEPVLKKIDKVLDLVREVDDNKSGYYIDRYSALPFVESVKEQAETRFKLSEKQLLGLNKVYKKYKVRYENMKKKKD